ncbi:MAG: YcxB family protein [Clostridia bacterium]|nr:YcxB family protein [Clostridia bacterium]
MEIKNTTAYTHDCLLEFNNSFRKKSRKLTNVLSIVAVSMLLLLLLMQGLLILMGEKPVLGGTSLAYVAAIILLYAVTQIATLLLTKRTVRKQAAMENVTDYLFTEEGFEQSTVSKTHRTQEQCPYSMLTSVTESERYFYLFINPRAAHIVSKNGFTEGTERDFRLLLRTVIDPQKLHIH